MSSNICGARTKSGNPCQNLPMKNGRCRMHGGLSLKGIASKRFKHGKYSKYFHREDEPAHKLCGAKTRSGKLCRSWAMANGRCKLHGGKTPGGVNSKNFKHGKYSRYEHPELYKE